MLFMDTSQASKNMVINPFNYCCEKTFVGNIKKHFVALLETFQVKWEHVLKFHMKGRN